ncbi:uncharacterized protein LOC123706972 [Pieris brassicae]|uniref:uncharacterized protein LOC123706972 n=1 Tax=Pieris brassicae TaxID=7116 RepID=UPI001E65FAA7|nr:uncharacterized protein LOC123706972 [Pieris brassicae]
MKIYVLFYAFVIVQVSGSFYDELQGAMHSVQHGFGKLLSDVVIDVTDTVHCTIAAVEHVLTLNGLMKSKSSYGHKCRSGPLLSIERYNNDPLEHFLKSRDAIEGKRFGHEIHKSISNINTTLTRVLDHHSGRRKIDSISKVLKHETEQLTKVSNMLRNELHSISQNVNSELEKFDTDITPSVWSELEEERNLENQIDNSRPARKHEGNSLSDPSNQPNSYTDAKREFDHMRDAVGQSSPPEDLPKTFRDVAEREKNKLNHNNDDNRDSKSIFDVDKSAFDKFSPFYDPESKNQEDHQRIIEDALSVIRDSHRTDQLMDDLNKSKVGADVFAAGKNVFNF